MATKRKRPLEDWTEKRRSPRNPFHKPSTGFKHAQPQLCPPNPYPSAYKTSTAHGIPVLPRRSSDRPHKVRSVKSGGNFTKHIRGVDGRRSTTRSRSRSPLANQTMQNTQAPANSTGRPLVSSTLGNTAMETQPLTEQQLQALRRGEQKLVQRQSQHLTEEELDARRRVRRIAQQVPPERQAQSQTGSLARGLGTTRGTGAMAMVSPIHLTISRDKTGGAEVRRSASLAYLGSRLRSYGNRSLELRTAKAISSMQTEEEKEVVWEDVVWE
ncbi:hypothetical protein F5Y03DRAFT_397792 [Xylaria venustula]|nr:hypothetical protein F5Y03DRAFT_397792 [Xylaria venustula]